MNKDAGAALDAYHLLGGIPLSLHYADRAQDALKVLTDVGFRYVGPDEVVVKKELAVEVADAWDEGFTVGAYAEANAKKGKKLDADYRNPYRAKIAELQATTKDETEADGSA